MHWTIALALLLPAREPALQSARTSDGHPLELAQEPVITVGDQAFATWDDYLSSALFRARNLRCGTRLALPSDSLRSTSDCSLDSTTVLPRYAPHRHELYRIPVVVHVIQSTGGSGQISDAMIASQIDVLNEDFRAIGGSLGQDGHDARIEFFLAAIDPGGSPTTGITRSTNNTWFTDSGGYYTTLAWDPARYLNIYTNQAGGALGYVPDLPQGGLVGSSADRVVVLWSAFGRNAPIGAPYHLGRTATHEVGHYLGLYHTFDFGCGNAGACYTTGDRICDTNPESSPVFGCPGSSSSCGSGDPFHNYMDYSDDPCYSEFTPEQINRMRCTLANWRVDLPEIVDCLPLVSIRNAGLNLDAFRASAPVGGEPLQLRIEAPGYGMATVYAQGEPQRKAFRNGMVGLVDPFSTPQFTLTVGLRGGSASMTLARPADLSLCGQTTYAQALVTGPGGWALTNALVFTNVP